MQTFGVNATAEFERTFVARGNVYLGDEPSDYLAIAGRGHFTNQLTVDADVYLGMDGVSKVRNLDWNLGKFDHISGIFGAYFGHISGIFRAYLTHIFDR